MNENFEENPNPSTFENLENLDNPSPYNNTQPQYPMPKRRSPRKFLYILGAVVIALVLLNLVRLISSKASKSTPTPTPTISIQTSPSPSETPSATTMESASPSPTPAASVNPIDSATGLDRSKLNVDVQNGSGVAGAGGKAATFLKGLGYNVVSTENADNFNYINVKIRVKSTAQNYLPLLNKDLSSTYSIGTTSSDLSATGSADALVIVGK